MFRMPTRVNYLMDPDYVSKCQDAFRQPPDKPALELFIPEEFRSPKLLRGVQDAMWRL